MIGSRSTRTASPCFSPKWKRGKRSATAEGHMSGTSEIKVVAAKQVVANASPETTHGNANGSVETAKNNGSYPAIRPRLPDERHSITHKFSVGGQEGYVTVGLYEDGAPGEMFIRMAKEGSTVSGLMDSFATAVSLALQYGVPLKVLCDKFSHTRFEPSGWSSNPEIGYAKSLMDYIFRWMALKFLPKDAQPQESASVTTPNGAEVAKAAELATQFSQAAAKKPESAESRVTQPQLAGVVHEDDAPTCSDCGALMVRNGSCYRCMNCGSTSGCS